MVDWSFEIKTHGLRLELARLMLLKSGIVARNGCVVCSPEAQMVCQRVLPWHVTTSSIEMSLPGCADFSCLVFVRAQPSIGAGHAEPV